MQLRKISITLETNTGWKPYTCAHLLTGFFDLLETLVKRTNLQYFQLDADVSTRPYMALFAPDDPLRQYGTVSSKFGSNNIVAWTRDPLKLGPLRSSKKRKLPNRALRSQ
jgi:hypothetical protein